MIIDCHGHYTTTPPQHARFREAQLAWLSDRSGPRPDPERITDDEIRESIEQNQLRALTERGADLAIFSPKALGMEHHVAERDIAGDWARTNNDLIHRVCQLFPDNFVGGACSSSVSWAATSTPTPPAGTGRRHRSPTAGGTPSTRRWASWRSRR